MNVVDILLHEGVRMVEEQDRAAKQAFARQQVEWAAILRRAVREGLTWWAANDLFYRSTGINSWETTERLWPKPRGGNWNQIVTLE